MRIVPIESIPDGSILGKTIYNNEGITLLTAGTILSSDILKTIKNYKIYSLYIIDKYSENEIEDIIKPELRQKTILSLKETFAYLSSIEKNKTSIKEMCKKSHYYYEKIEKLAEELLDDILSKEDILVNLIDIKNMDNYTYQHSVNVAVLSIVIGVGLKLKKSTLINLAMGALLHDIGKVFIPKEILNKQGPLTDEEFLIIKKHPKLGYDYLSKHFNLKTCSLLISLQHHERIDGTGYPLNLKGNKINYLSKIVSIADVYDALTSDRSYKKAFSSSDSLEFIMANANSMFDLDIVSVFSKLVVPFPFGTIVRLSNGDIGVVQETPTNFPLRPDVKIIESSNKNYEGTSISLIDELSLVISEVKNDYVKTD